MRQKFWERIGGFGKYVFGMVRTLWHLRHGAMLKGRWPDFINYWPLPLVQTAFTLSPFLLASPSLQTSCIRAPKSYNMSNDSMPCQFVTHHHKPLLCMNSIIQVLRRTDLRSLKFTVSWVINWLYVDLLLSRWFARFYLVTRAHSSSFWRIRKFELHNA